MLVDFPHAQRHLVLNVRHELDVVAPQVNGGHARLVVLVHEDLAVCGVASHVVLDVGRRGELDDAAKNRGEGG